MQGDSLTLELKGAALAAGFSLAGVARADDPMLAEAVERYGEWLDRGRGAGMEYLRRHVPFKSDPSKLLPGWRSVLCVALAYGEPPRPDDAGRARVSIYTRGRDYHALMAEKLRGLADWLACRGVGARPFVDAEPVLERFWAWRAGLGWVGKNAMLINRREGSYLFLGGLLVDRELGADAPGTDHCGRCRKCIEACPTQAIVEGARQLDAARCIAYHTIENRGPVPPEVMAGTGRWIAGCDICQEVCPWNDPVMPGPAFESTNPAFDADLRELARWSADDFKARIGKGIAMGRMKYAGFVRNVAIAVANSGLAREAKLEALASLERSVATLPEGTGRDGAQSALSWAKSLLR